MSDQAAFHAAMRADPSDATTRLVYADWLEEHGHDEPARRLRWFAGLLPHLAAVENMPTGIHSYDVDQPDPHLPNWARQLVIQHSWREQEKDRPNHYQPGSALHTAVEHNRSHVWPASELHAIGLLPEHPPAQGGFITPRGAATASEGAGPSRLFKEAVALHLASKHNADNNVKLAAIEAPNRTGGSVLVKVPTPVPTAPQAPEATGPATPLPNDGPAPKQPKNSGPAFILPQ